jgi:2-methylcitrate dehydratase PrpD
VLPDPELDRRYPREWPARVTITTSRGTFSAESALPPGHPAKPMAFAESVERFRRSAVNRLTQEQADAAIRFVGALADRSDMSGLVRCICPQAPPSSAALTP